MSNSSLISYTKISPNKNHPRNHAIDTITIHCYVGQSSVESAGSWFAQSSAQCSCNYMIGTDGRIGLIVDEGDRSWCSSSRDNDNRAVTIECASDSTHPYAINSKVYNSLIHLCADICRRNDIKELKWKADKSLIGQIDKQNMTVHRWFANKACPGDYIYNRYGQIASEVNALLALNQEVTKEVTEKVATATHPWIKAARKLNKQMKADVAAGKNWHYWNSGGGKENTFEKAEKNGAYVTNCAHFICWCLKEAGLLKPTQSFYGSKDHIHWTGTGTEKLIKEECEIIEIKGKYTVRQLLAKKMLKPGDVLTYWDIYHTNMYGYKDKWYDAGHAYCKEQGDGAKFITWCGGCVHAEQRVAYIIRLKSVEPFKLRVDTSKHEAKIRKGPGSKYDVIKTIKSGTYTITDIGGSNDRWGMLSDGSGWIYLPWFEKCIYEVKVDPKKKVVRLRKSYNNTSDVIKELPAGTYGISSVGGSKDRWGKLSDGSGWIYLPYVTKV